MKCASFIHVYYYDFIEEMKNLFPNQDKEKLSECVLDYLMIPEGGDAASYFLPNPNKYEFFNVREYHEFIAPFFMKHFPEENGIYVDID